MKSGLTLRRWLVLIVACLAVNTALSLAGIWLAWWRPIVLDLVMLVGICLWWDRHLIRARRRLRKAMRQPLVLDEDGRLHVPVLAPGESVDMIVSTDGKYVAAQVVRPDGSVRLQSDWSTRH